MALQEQPEKLLFYVEIILEENLRAPSALYKLYSLVTQAYLIGDLPCGLESVSYLIANIII